MEIRHFNDLEFTVVATVHSRRVDFAVYDMENLPTGGVPPLWHRAGSPHHPDPVTSIEEAEPYLHGEVKWDGCSNWYFDQQTRVMLHGCSRQDVQRFGDIMGACWDWASELLPNFDQ